MQHSAAPFYYAHKAAGKFHLYEICVFKPKGYIQYWRRAFWRMYNGECLIESVYRRMYNE